MLRKLPRWTGRAALLALSFLLLCVPPVFIAGPAGYLPALTLLFAVLICLAYLQILARGIVCEDMTSAHNCRRRETMRFSLEMKNGTPLVCPRVDAVFFQSDLFGEVDVETPVSVTLTPGESRHFGFDVRFDHIGKYQVGLREIRVYGLLGIFPIRLSAAAQYAVEVMPKIWELGQVAISEQVQAEDPMSRIKASTDGGDYSGIREYVMGDPIKNIHWKLSAHASVYMTKQMEAYGNPGVTVILDLLSDPGHSRETMMDLFDGVVESAVSVAYFAQSHGLECDLYYLNRQGTEDSFSTGDAKDLGELVWDIPPITADPERYDVQRLLRRVGRDLYAKNNIVLCTSRVTVETVQRLLEIRRARRTPLLFFVLPPGLDDRDRADRLRPLAPLEAAGIAYYVINAAHELGR